MAHISSRKRAQLKAMNSTVMAVQDVGMLLLVFMMVGLVTSIFQNLLMIRFCLFICCVPVAVNFVIMHTELFNL
jgi:hypothetical protein